MSPKKNYEPRKTPTRNSWIWNSEFIEKAIRSGYKIFPYEWEMKIDHVSNLFVYFSNPRKKTRQRELARIFLDPSAWRAVGKCESWSRLCDEVSEAYCRNNHAHEGDGSHAMMIQFINNIWKYEE